MFFQLNLEKIKKFSFVLKRVHFILGFVGIFILSGAEEIFSEKIPLLKLNGNWQAEIPLIKGEISEGKNKIHSVMVDPSGRGDYLLFILTSKKNVNLRLISPDGVLLDPLEVKQHSGIKYQETPIDKVYIIENPKKGIWKAEIFLTKTSKKEKYELRIILRSRIILKYLSSYYYSSYYYSAAWHPQQPYLPVNLEVSFFDGESPITKAEVIAEIKKPDSSIVKLKLKEDPLRKGRYFCIFKDTRLKGRYRVTFKAVGKTKGEKIERKLSVDLWIDVFVDLAILSSDIKFSKKNPYTDEEIEIYATIHNIGEAPAKDVEVFFFEYIPKEEELKEIGKVKILEIAPGKRKEVSIKYKTPPYAGKYHIRVVISPFLSFLEKDYDNNKADKEIMVSGPFLPYFTGNFSDYAEDRDGDGVYDYLTVEVEVNISRDGYYDITGWLYAGGRKDLEKIKIALERKEGWEWYEKKYYVGFTNNYSYLKKGLNKVKLRFPAGNIYKKLKPGGKNSFVLASLMLKDDNRVLDFRKIAYITSSYSYEKFARYYGKITGCVVDENLKPVIGARVTVTGKRYSSVITKEDGTYVIEDLPAGEYKVKVDPLTYILEKKTVSVKVSAGKEIKVNFRLKKRF